MSGIQKINAPSTKILKRMDLKNVNGGKYKSEKNKGAKTEAKRKKRTKDFNIFSREAMLLPPNFVDTVDELGYFRLQLFIFGIALFCLESKFNCPVKVSALRMHLRKIDQ